MDRFEQRKQHLIGIAETCFSRYGFEKSSMKSIAEDAGIAKASLYYYFPSKEELFLEVLKKELDEYRLKLNNFQEQSVDIIEKIHKFLEVPVMIYEKYGHTLMRLILKVSTTGLPSVDSQFESIWKTTKKVFSDLLNEGINQGFIRSDLDVEFLADSYLLMLAKGLFVDGEKYGMKITKNNKVSTYHKMVDILLKGILER